MGPEPASPAPFIRVKICGITRPEDGLVAAEAGADAIGLVFDAASPRRVGAPAARRVLRVLPPFVSVVGVFAEESPARILEIARDFELSAVQLHHRKITRDLLEALEDLRVIPAVRMGKPEDVKELSRFKGAAAVLADAKSEDRAGGTGQSFPWEWLKGASIQRPLILAGGLRPDTVGAAVRLLRPYAVDVSSGVESEPGIKDARKIHAFIHAARAALNDRE